MHFSYLFLYIQLISKVHAFVPHILQHPRTDRRHHNQQPNSIGNTLIQERSFTFSSGPADNKKRHTKPMFIGGRPINPLSTTSISVSGTCRCPLGCQPPCTLKNGLCWSHQCGNTHYSFLGKIQSQYNSNVLAAESMKDKIDQQHGHFNSNQKDPDSFLAVRSKKDNIPDIFLETEEFSQKDQFGPEQGEVYAYAEDEQFDPEQGRKYASDDDEEQYFHQNIMPKHNKNPMTDEFIEYTRKLSV